MRFDKKLSQLFRGPVADKGGFEEVYDRLAQEIDIRRKALEANKGTIILWMTITDISEYKSSRELPTALAKVYRHHRVAQQVIKEFGGVPIKFLTDGLVATFEFDGTESVLKALNSAIKIQKECAKINITIPNDDDKLKTQIGITAGFVIDFSSYNPTGQIISDPQGIIVDLAQKLSEIAKPEQILTHDKFFNSLPSKIDEVSFSQPTERRIRGFSQPLQVYEINWDNRTRNISFPPPMFFESGYLTSDFINTQLSLAKSKLIITGHTNHRFTDDFDFRNSIAEKIDKNPDFKLSLVFLNPYSSFTEYARQITRRRIENMEHLVIENIYKGSQMYKSLSDNVTFAVSDYSMIIPFTQRDEELFFAVPIRSHPSGKKFVGMTGGPYFRSQTESPIAQEIIQNHYEQSDRIELNLEEISKDISLIKKLIAKKND